MTNATTTATSPATTTVATAAPAVVVPKAPSKKSLAKVIFDAGMAKRSAGGYSSNKEFRTDVVHTISKELTVTIASASTMYNSFKKEAEDAAALTGAVVGLGRDPKKVKVATEPKPRGRKPKAVAPAADAVATTEPVAADATVIVVDTAAETAPAETASA